MFITVLTKTQISPVHALPLRLNKLHFNVTPRPDQRSPDQYMLQVQWATKAYAGEEL